MFGIARDITERQKLLEDIEWQATHDPLTGLPNRTLLADRFDRAIGNAKRSGKPILICMLDLDDFKPVNDTYGHETCQKLGIKFALDDFGTGYSSLNYLKRLPTDTLKIDQSFMQDILDNEDDFALVQAIISLAHNFKRNVIAEGVETQKQAELLVELGCEQAQGYGIAKPMSAEDVVDWAQKYSHLQSSIE